MILRPSQAARNYLLLIGRGLGSKEKIWAIPLSSGELLNNKRAISPLIRLLRSRALCCFDTVGAIGIPQEIFRSAAPRAASIFGFSNTELGSHIAHAFRVYLEI